MVITTKLSQRRYHECFVICRSLISTTPFSPHPLTFLSLSLTYSLSLSPLSLQCEILTDEETVFELAACVMQAQHGDYKSYVQYALQ